MANMARSIANVLRSRRGVTASEYAILAVAVVIVVGSAISLLIEPSNSAFRVAGSTLLSTQAGLGASR
jgi:Flp pilus assembly pilin Flp